MHKQCRAVLLAGLVFLNLHISSVSAVPPGDLNCNGLVGPDDVGPFVLALTDPVAYRIAHPFCSLHLGDFTGDSNVDGDDIEPFLFALLGPPAATIETELAGRPLPAYPFFEYTAALQADEAVRIAIDPGRFPSIVGRTCDVYVVPARTDYQWAADPSLVDASAAVETVTFGGTTIQANTFIVAAAGELASSAGTTDIGRPYDVVCDCDQNGQFNTGDIIDGLGDPEAGFYYVHDLTVAGPLATTTITYSVTGVTSGFTFERTVYPTAIAGMGRLPLVVISHGNGHNYTWYLYLQTHLASYGYIVMSHQNNTVPGPESASTTTLEHTNAIIGQQATIAGGVLNNHIDDQRIIWIGHSRGGEGVARGYDRLFDGTYVPANYGLADIVCVSSIAPTDFLGTNNSDPHAANYHLIYGAADGDVTGEPANNAAKSLPLYERGVGTKMVNYLQGCGHNEFNCCGPNDATGPNLIGRPAVQTLARAYYLALVKYFAEGSIPAKDYFTRMYEKFHPIGVAANAIMTNEYRDAVGTGVVLDDYQTQTATNVSSSGGAVTFNVQNAVEDRMLDIDGSFAFSPSVPMNGMTRARSTLDNPRCIVFDWSVGTDRFYELAVPGAMSNFSDDDFLTFRACQGTRHPETDGLNAPLSFTVTLRDANGATSSIPFASYGRITRTYQRTGFGAGAGWANEFGTVRLRLTDFLNNGSGLDLSSIVAVRFDFGASFGSARGRIGLDDVALSPG